MPEIVKCPTGESCGRLAIERSDPQYQPRRNLGDESVPKTLRSESARPSCATGDIRVLICDDESRLVNLTAGLLREFGFDVLTVKSGQDAIACVSQQPIDVVILDVNLPGEDTLLVARGLLETSHVAIVLSSGFAEEDVESELMSLPGVRAFLAKPYRIEALSSTIRRVVESSG